MSEPSWENFLEFIQSTPPPPQTLNYFKSVDWTRLYVENSNYKAVAVLSRILKSNAGDTYFARTVSSSSTIAHWLCLVLKNFHTVAESRTSLPLEPAPSISSKSPATESVPERPDCIFLLQLGTDLNGFQNTIHGGVLCAILDESLSMCVEIHRQLTTDSRTMLYTARLDVNYRAPVISPACVAVKVWLQARQRRKWLMRGQVESIDGTILTEATGLWVSSQGSRM